MALGTFRGENRTYLSVAFGKLRKKTLSNGERVNANTPNAVKRTSQSGTDSWAIEYDFVEAMIEDVFYREDQKYGNSFEVVMRAGLDLYQISFSDDSRYWFDLAKKLPLVKTDEMVKISTYDFIDREGKRRAGTSVSQNGVKIDSFYTDYKDGKWTYKHDYPTAEGVDWKDKDELKIYMIKLKKFFIKEHNQRIKPMFEEDKEFATAPDDIPAVEEEELPDDDLPF